MIRSMGDTWQSEEAWIVIGRPQSIAIGGTKRSSDRHQTVAIVRDLGNGRSLLVRPISITLTSDLHQETITIGRLAENSNRDHGARDQLHRDRSSNWSSSNGGLSLTKNQDRAAIVSRSRGDRGLIARRSWLDRAAIVAYSASDREPRRRDVKTLPRRHRPMPTTPSMAQKSGGMINVKL